MLLATASFTLPCHASSASINAKNSKSGSGSSSNPNSNNNHNHKSQKLARLQSSSQKNSTAVVATTTAALMKTIAVRANRSGGFSNDANVQKTTATTQANSKTNANIIVNDNFKKVIASNSNTLNTTNSSSSNHNSKNTSKSTAVNSAVNIKTTASNTTSSSSSSTLNATSAAIKSIIPTASFLKTYTVPPTVLHRSPKARLRSCSRDSLHNEMCHFKPIRSLPLTPLKSGTHSRGFSLKAPKPNLGTSTTNCDHTTIKRVVDRENQRGKLQSKQKNESRLSSNIFQNMKPHLSAFVRLQPNVSIDLQQIFSVSKSPILTKAQEKKLSKNTKIEKPMQAKKLNKKKSETKTAQQKTTTSAVLSTTKVTAVKLSSNSRKRKAQTNLKQNDKIECKKPRRKTKDKTKNIKQLNRKTPPLTRGRIRIEGGYSKLVGPLV